VFESIKVFLEIDGFVFIMGLSREALDKVITAKYEKMGLAGVTGEQYIRKIIQIEVNIQKWKDYAIGQLISKLAERLDEQYSHYIANKDIQELIMRGLEHNPREVKRFINNFIVALSANPSLKSKPNIFLMSQVLTKFSKPFSNRCAAKSRGYVGGTDGDSVFTTTTTLRS
jgi:hypothetical protein